MWKDYWDLWGRSYSGVSILMVIFAVPLGVSLNVGGWGVLLGVLGISLEFSLVIQFLFVPASVFRQNCSDLIELILEFFLTIILI